MSVLTPADLRTALSRLPRARLAHLPTPLEPLPRLSAALGGIDLRIKRDDCTGLAMGGNKTRQLEFTIGEALAHGADTLVQGADAQSNHCRQTAAAAAKLGLECHLVLCRTHHHEEPDAPPQGNLLLDRLFGAKIHWTEVGIGAELEAEKVRVADELRSQGKKPYVIGGSRGKLLSAAGYVNFVAELRDQCDELGWKPDYLYSCTSTATHIGLLVGLRALGWKLHLQGIAPIVWGYDVPAMLAKTATELGREIGIEIDVKPEEIRHSEDYVGPAYGLMTRESRVAIELMARTEGILLDVAYTGKAVAGLIDHVRRGVIAPGSKALYLHTGGTPALFCYADELTS
jgi:D-cysteine desulfhydrase family pyridoxal phosphate-dependent enzyme